MTCGAWRLRTGALTLLGALAVHKLRYLLAGVEQDAHAHSYMQWALAVACALGVLAALEFGGRLVRRLPDEVPQAGVRWLGISSLLMAIFATQELAELLIAHGRVDVAESLAVHGGWLAAPLALAAGAVIALLVRGARALLARVARRRHVTAARHARQTRPQTLFITPRAGVLARKLAGRAPPVAVA